MAGCKLDYLGIVAMNVLADIEAGNPDWESKVPPKVAEIIKSRKFFGYQGKEDQRFTNPGNS